MVGVELPQSGQHRMLPGGLRGRLAQRREQRQILRQETRWRARLGRFEALQHLGGAADDGGRQAGQTRHMDAVGAIGPARRDLVQEHHVAAPFLDPHGVGGEPRQAAGEGGQLVVMGGEQPPAAHPVVQMLDHRPGQRQPVEGGGAAADLVEDDETAFGGLMEDRRGLHHLDHECGAAAGEIVGRPDPRKEPVDEADLGGLGGHEAAALGEHGDQRVLPEKGALAGHVGTGQQPQPPAFRKIAVVGDEALVAAGEGLLHHRMAAADDAKGGILANGRAHIALLDGEGGEGRRQIDGGHRCRGGSDGPGRLQHRVQQFGEDRLLARQRPLGGTGELLLQRRQLPGGKAGGVGHALALQEARRHLVAMGGGDLDVVAQQIVVADLERGDAGLLAVATLERSDVAPSLIAQVAQSIELRIDACAQEPALAARGRRAVHEGREQSLGERAKIGDAGGQRHQRRGGLAEPAGEPGGGVETAADGQQIPRPAASQGQAGECAIEIRHALQELAHAPAQIGIVDEGLDPVEPLADGGGIAERGRQALGQQPCAGAGYGAVDRMQQAALALARKVFRELQIAAGGGVDAHHPLGGDAPWRFQTRQMSLLGEQQIVQESAGGGQFGPAEGTQAFEGGEAEMLAQPSFAMEAVEADAGGVVEPLPPLLELGGYRRIRRQAGRGEDLPGIDARQQARQIGGIAGFGEEIAGRHVDPGHRRPLPQPRQRRQVVVAPRVEQTILGQGAGGDHPYHVTCHQRLAAALAGLGRILELLADGDLEAFADQPLQIELGTVHRHPAHGDVHAGVPAPSGQRDVEGGCRLLGILEEQLVEIAHAEEQQGTRMSGLERLVLGDHRRGLGLRRGSLAGRAGRHRFRARCCHRRAGITNG